MYLKQKLVTEKYWHQVLQEQMKESRRKRSRKAIADFVTFLYGLVAIGGVLVAAPYLRQWLSTLQ